MLSSHPGPSALPGQRRGKRGLGLLGPWGFGQHVEGRRQMGGRQRRSPVPEAGPLCTALCPPRWLGELALPSSNDPSWDPLVCPVESQAPHKAPRHPARVSDLSSDTCTGSHMPCTDTCTHSNTPPTHRRPLTLSASRHVAYTDPHKTRLHSADPGTTC